MRAVNSTTVIEEHYRALLRHDKKKNFTEICLVLLQGIIFYH